MDQNITTVSPIPLSLKEKFPIGMILIFILISFDFIPRLFTFLISITNSKTQFGPFFLSGFPVVFYGIILLAVFILFFYGTLRRKMWTKKLFIGWYFISIGILFLNFISFLVDKQGILNLYKEMLPITGHRFTESSLNIVLISELLQGLIIGLIVIFYIYRKQDFFRN